MANRSYLGGVLLDVDPHHAEAETEIRREAESKPSLRLLVMGDFSGQATGKLARLDRDNFESVMRGLAPRVELTIGNGQLADTELTFTSLDDFEPDSIYRKTDLFAALRAGAAPLLYSEPEEGEAKAPVKPTAEQIDRLTSAGGLLDAIAERSSGGSFSAAAPAPKRIDEFQSMVERIAAPYVAPNETAESRRAAIEIAQRRSLLMSHILHNEQFQAMEAAWRGLDLLVRTLDTDTLIHLYLLDCAKDQLDVRLKNAVSSQDSFTLVIANFAFDRATLSEVELLSRISLAARSVGAPFIAECLPSRNEDAKAEVAWQALRRTGAAGYLGLALPRFLVRLPYGKDTIPVDSFDYEEMSGDPVHTDYLWGNPAFACALVLAELWEQRGSFTTIPANLRLSGMPLHVFVSNGEAAARPCTEVLFSDRDCATLLSEGSLPLAAMKATDTIVFPRMQSIADPPSVLAGFQSMNW
jgi:type VI secretion system protein ImpC